MCLVVSDIHHFPKMKLAAFFMLIAYAVADKLQNNYLPPANSGASDGGEFLTAPSRVANVFAGFRSSRPTSASYNVYHSSQFGKSASLVDRPNVAFRNSEFSSSGPQIPILRLTSENNGEGSYRFAYETDNSISHEEEGHQETIGAEQGNIVHGSYTYQSPEGQTFTVHYIADENGFRATGDHLPVAPPVPEAIQRSLNHNLITKQSLVDVSRTNNEDHIGANSDNSEAHDLNSVEVGRNDGGNVNRQYLGPFKNNNNGYRY
ncbi:pupal cuticle protein 20-like [Diabrotica virgifera virgifera]|uniref:Pupal cuticle protein 20-like n=1 Tax=Diabrotica virgifera virgifera TaxID=50390 RepID=A0ABM5IQ42_DIAVI|nr:pupal cuticle protein 20-like [Diabrotica virgifera virgifera]